MLAGTDRVATALCWGDHIGSVSLALPSSVGDPHPVLMECHAEDGESPPSVEVGL